MRLLVAIICGLTLAGCASSPRSADSGGKRAEQLSEGRGEQAVRCNRPDGTARDSNCYFEKPVPERERDPVRVIRVPEVSTKLPSL